MDWSLYENIVSQLFEPLVKEDGISDDELDAAEARLGAPLPRLLRQLYSLTGRRGDLHRACEDLILPPALLHDAGYLSFYQNTVAQSRWCVPMERGDDPPVFGWHEGAWVPDYPRLSQFLFAMLFWQATNGGAEYYARGTVSAAALQVTPDGYRRLALGGDWGLVALWGGRVALLYSAATTGTLHPILVAYQDPTSLTTLLEAFPEIVWEGQGRRKAQVRYRNYDLSQRCAGCGRSKLTWADTTRGVCARCGHPL